MSSNPIPSPGTPLGSHAAIRIQHPQYGLIVFYPVDVALPTGNPATETRSRTPKIEHDRTPDEQQPHASCRQP